MSGQPNEINLNEQQTANNGGNRPLAFIESILSIIQNKIDPVIIADVIQQLDAGFDHEKLNNLTARIDIFKKSELKITQLEREVTNQNSTIKQKIDHVAQQTFDLSEMEKQLFKKKRCESSHLFVFKYMDRGTTKNKKEPKNPLEKILCVHEELTLEIDYVQQLIHQLNKEKQLYLKKLFVELRRAIAEYHGDNYQLFKAVVQRFLTIQTEQSKKKEKSYAVIKKKVEQTPSNMQDPGLAAYFVEFFSDDFLSGQLSGLFHSSRYCFSYKASTYNNESLS